MHKIVVFVISIVPTAFSFKSALIIL